ncbi:hypothetical protein [Streptomyces sp. H27-D2]|uniref:hypothetical protein n=1 Tax=Streptomyces sp. H27-D2 TaxID=3046304 RepID=UPI002DBA248B|nr:hypothetical protein [Streptomyces sp. H27-D2]MEC4017419.1 hypothetical protein [Streptomyces sp. H27-D2]
MSFGQGGPYGPGGSQPSTPDWAAMADVTAARNRRRRWALIGGGALATAAVAAIVATAVVTTNDNGKGDGKNAGGLPSAESLPSEPAEPEPSFSKVAPPPAPKPLDYISDVKKDTAPLTAATLFPDKRAVKDARSYGKATTNSTKSCAAATQGALGSVLASNGCRQVIRSTYTKDGVAVTVGVAVFDTKAASEKAKNQAKGNIASLPGGGVPAFCRATACRLTANAVGRYNYFTVAGYTSGKAVTSADRKALQAGRDAADYTFRRIMQRGNAQAAAAATTAD